MRLRVVFVPSGVVTYGAINPLLMCTSLSCVESCAANTDWVIFIPKKKMSRYDKVFTIYICSSYFINIALLGSSTSRFYRCFMCSRPHNQRVLGSSPIWTILFTVKFISVLLEWRWQLEAYCCLLCKTFRWHIAWHDSHISGVLCHQRQHSSLEAINKHGKAKRKLIHVAKYCDMFRVLHWT